jgi:hypothetical protein
VSGSSAETLLRAAAAEPDRLQRHLLVAAALHAALTDEPIVVGGTAEEFHAAAEYHETDLDLCGRVTQPDRAVLHDLGFRKRGRHWFHEASKVAVEFPEERIDGDEERVERLVVRGGTVAIIGVDDLYLDRLRQATAPFRPDDSMEFQSALAVAAGAFERIDRRYVLRRIREIEAEDRQVANSMRALDSKIMRRVRRALST